MCREGRVSESQNIQVLPGGSLTFQSPPGKAEMEPIISESTKTPTGYIPPVLLTQMANKIGFIFQNETYSQNLFYSFMILLLLSYVGHALTNVTHTYELYHVWTVYPTI